MIIQDVSDEEMKKLADRFEKLSGYESDPEIVNRAIILDLRRARKKMIGQLKSTNTNMNDIESVMKLIDTEMDVLKKLKISNETLEQDFKSLEDQLNVLEIECKQSDSLIEVVDITSIACRVIEIDDKVTNMIFERLGQYTQIEY
jgi:septal ring factor EnvC (AmiA/AmiB activator)